VGAPQPYRAVRFDRTRDCYASPSGRGFVRRIGFACFLRVRDGDEVPHFLPRLEVLRIEPRAVALVDVTSFLPSGGERVVYVHRL